MEVASLTLERVGGAAPARSQYFTLNAQRPTLNLFFTHNPAPSRYQNKSVAHEVRP
jgi:hypothetical protein